MPGQDQTMPDTPAVPATPAPAPAPAAPPTTLGALPPRLQGEVIAKAQQIDPGTMQQFAGMDTARASQAIDQTVALEQKMLKAMQGKMVEAHQRVMAGDPLRVKPMLQQQQAATGQPVNPWQAPAAPAPVLPTGQGYADMVGRVAGQQAPAQPQPQQPMALPPGLGLQGPLAAAQTAVQEPQPDVIDLLEQQAAAAGKDYQARMADPRLRPAETDGPLKRAIAEHDANERLKPQGLDPLNPQLPPLKSVDRDRLYNHMDDAAVKVIADVTGGTVANAKEADRALEWLRNNDYPRYHQALQQINRQALNAYNEEEAVADRERRARDAARPAKPVETRLPADQAMYESTTGWEDLTGIRPGIGTMPADPKTQKALADIMAAGPKPVTATEEDLPNPVMRDMVAVMTAQDMGIDIQGASPADIERKIAEHGDREEARKFRARLAADRAAFDDLSASEKAAYYFGTGILTVGSMAVDTLEGGVRLADWALDNTAGRLGRELAEAQTGVDTSRKSPPSYAQFRESYMKVHGREPRMTADEWAYAQVENMQQMRAKGMTGEKDRIGDAFNYLFGGMRSHQELLGNTPAARLASDDESLAFYQKGTSLAQGIGSMLGFTVTMGAGRAIGFNNWVAAVSAGMPVTGNAFYKSAIAGGASPENAELAMLIGAGIGASEGLPLERMMRRASVTKGVLEFAKTDSKLRKFYRAAVEGGKDAVAGSGEEFFQETFQNLGENITAKSLYDYDRNVFEGVVEAGYTGGLLGFMFQGMITGGQLTVQQVDMYKQAKQAGDIERAQALLAEMAGYKTKDIPSTQIEQDYRDAGGQDITTKPFPDQQRRAIEDAATRAGTYTPAVGRRATREDVAQLNEQERQDQADAQLRAQIDSRTVDANAPDPTLTPQGEPDANTGATNRPAVGGADVDQSVLSDSDVAEAADGQAGVRADEVRDNGDGSPVPSLGENQGPRNEVAARTPETDVSEQATTQPAGEPADGDQAGEVAEAKKPWEMAKAQARGVLDAVYRDSPDTASMRPGIEKKKTIHRLERGKLNKLTNEFNATSMPSQELRDRLAKQRDKVDALDRDIKDAEREVDQLARQDASRLLQEFPDLFTPTPGWPYVVGTQRFSDLGFGHRDAVRKALAAGEAVPADVLADYPDLAKPFGGEPDARTETDGATAQRAEGDRPAVQEAQSQDDAAPAPDRPGVVDGTAAQAAPAQQPAPAPVAAGEPLTEVAQGKTKEQIVNPIPLKASVKAKVQALVRLTRQSQPVLERIMQRMRDELNLPEVKDNIKKPEKIAEKAVRPSVLAKKPWFGVEHIRDSYRFKAVINRLEDVEGIYRILREEGVGFVEIDTAKMVDPLPYGWRMAAFDLRMPNGQMVELYTPLKEVEAVKDEMHLIFEKWRNEDRSKMTDAQRAEMDADIATSYRTYNEAYLAALAREGLDEAQARASWARIEALVGSDSRSKSVINSSPSTDRADQVPSGSRTAQNPEPSTITPPSSATNTESDPGEIFEGSDIAQSPGGEPATTNIVPETVDLSTASGSIIDKKPTLDERQRATGKTIKKLMTTAEYKAYRHAMDELGGMHYAHEELALNMTSEGAKASWQAIKDKTDEVNAMVEKAVAREEARQGKTNDTSTRGDDPRTGQPGDDQGAGDPAGARSAGPGQAGRADDAGAGSGLRRGPAIDGRPVDEADAGRGDAGEAGDGPLGEGRGPEADGRTGPADARPPETGAPQARAQAAEPDADPGVVEADTDRANPAGYDPELIDRPAKDDPARNHHIAPDENPAPTNDTKRFAANMQALRLLAALRLEKRLPTPDEKRTLAQYTGFGWANFESATGERQLKELNALLTKEEVAAIKKSTLNAHYTSIEVIDAMWKMVERLGFKGGRVLEPAAGIGHFIGVMPEHLADRTRVKMVELDRVSGAITQMLYPEAEVEIDGFQHTPIDNGTIDLAISNIPFGGFKASGAKDYPDLLIHDYFFARSLDKVKPGGLVAFITSNGTLDKMEKKARQQLADRADLIAAIRLPGGSKGAFSGNAKTEVTTDILFFRKRTATPWAGAQDVPDWIGTVEEGMSRGKPIRFNAYYQARPEHALGTHSNDNTQYSGDPRYQLNPDLSRPIAEQLAGVIDSLPTNIMAPESVEGSERTGQEAPKGSVELSHIQQDGQWFQVVGGRLTPAPWLTQVNYGNSWEKAIEQKELDRRKAVAPLFYELAAARDAVIKAELSGAGKTELDTKRKALNEVYDRVVKETKTPSYASINRPQGQQHNAPFTFLIEDPAYFKVLAMEREVSKDDPKTGKTTYTYTKQAIFEKATVAPAERPVAAQTPADAISISLNYDGHLNMGTVAQLLGVSPEVAAQRVRETGQAFLDPESGKWMTRETYLSGPVLARLHAARAAVAQGQTEFAANVEALEQAQPPRIPIGKVDFRLASRWIPDEAIQMWARQNIGPGIGITYLSPLNTYEVSGESSGSGDATYGTDRVDAATLLGKALDGQQHKVYDTIGYGDSKTRVLNKPATEAAARAMRQIERAFGQWAKTSQDTINVNGEDVPVGVYLEEVYNQVNNGHAEVEHNGEHLTFPGLSKDVWLKPYRTRAVARILHDRGAVLAHGVGSGKAQPLDARILTPTGWTTMGQIKVGDQVIGRDGMPTSVVGVYPQGVRDVYEVQMSDGSATRCCDEHLWLTHTDYERSKAGEARKLGKDWSCAQPKVRPLSEIRSTLVGRNGTKNHAIPVVRAVHMDPRPVPLDPYLLGVLLGDGCLKFAGCGLSNPEEEIVMAVAQACPEGVRVVATGHGCDYRLTMDHPGGRRTHPVMRHIRAMGLNVGSHEKFVPEDYKINSIDVRLAMLQGLMDTDGYVENDGYATKFCTTSSQLADDVTFLVRSLGGIATSAMKYPKGGRPAWVLNIVMPAAINPFRLKRKRDAVIPKSKYPPRRFITAVEKVSREPVQCIAVDHPDHLYVTDDLIVTHNTLTMIMAAHELVRTGLARKNLIVVKKPTITDFGTAAQAAYPTGNVLVATDKSFSKGHRERFMHQIAVGDYDTVIITQEQFTKLAMSKPMIEAYFFQQRIELEQAIKDAAALAGKKDPTTKKLEAAKEAMEAKQARMLADLAERQDAGLTFEELGFDQVFIDEAHDFKKIPINSRMQNVKGIPNDTSQRALHLDMVTQYVQSRGGGIVLATGTPITNTVAEAYVMLKLARPDVLRSYGISNFDEFAHTFGEAVEDMEFTYSMSFKFVTRFNRLVNLPELTRMIRQGFDVAIGNEKLGLKVPKIKGGAPTITEYKATPAVERANDRVMEAVDAFDALDGQGKRDNSWVPIVAMGYGTAAALDPRLVDPNAIDDPGSKVNLALEEVKRIHKKYNKVKGVQLIFADRYRTMNTQKLDDFIGTGTGLSDDELAAAMVADNPDEGDKRKALDDDAAQEAAAVGDFNLYHDIRNKLVAAGIPREQIAIIGEHDTDTKRRKLFEDANAGKVRIILGSTEKLGVGVNVQKKLVALHALDPPRDMTPAKVEQRLGRIIRQGHEEGHPGAEEVEVFYYGVAKTMDAGVWQKIEQKGRFIDAMLSGNVGVRTMEDLSGDATNAAAEFRARLSGDPRALRLLDLGHKLKKLADDKAGYEQEISQAVKDLHYRKSQAALAKQAGKQLDAARPDVEAAFEPLNNYRALVAQQVADIARAEAPARADMHAEVRATLEDHGLRGVVAKEEVTIPGKDKPVDAYVWRRDGQKPMVLATNIKDTQARLIQHAAENPLPKPDKAPPFEMVLEGATFKSFDDAAAMVWERVEAAHAVAIRESRSQVVMVKVQAGGSKYVLKATVYAEADSKTARADGVLLDANGNVVSGISSTVRDGRSLLAGIVLDAPRKIVNMIASKERQRQEHLDVAEALAARLETPWDQQQVYDKAIAEFDRLRAEMSGQQEDPALAAAMETLLGPAAEGGQGPTPGTTTPTGRNSLMPPVRYGMGTPTGGTPATPGPATPAADPTTTAEFRRFFGDWQNDPANASKVVDADGKPLVVYHGTWTKDLTVFDRLAKAKERRGAKVDTIGSWFTTDQQSAVRGYGPEIVDVYLSIKNPRRYKGTGDQDSRQQAAKQLWHDVEKAGGAEAFRADQMRRGYDGIVIENDNVDNLPGDVWVAFSPTQIKSATGNVGTYDPTNPDIRAAAPVPAMAGVRLVDGNPLPGQQADRAAKTPAGEKLVIAIRKDTEGNHAGLRAINEFLLDAVKAEMREGLAQVTGKMPAFYMEGGYHLIRAKTNTFQLVFHEVGHALHTLLRDTSSSALHGLGPMLIDLTKAPGSYASAHSIHEGFAEYIRRYVSDPASIDVALRKRVAAVLKQHKMDGILDALDDARLAMEAHLARSNKAKLRSYMKDRPRVGVSDAKELLYLKWHTVLYNLSAGSALDTRVSKRMFDALETYDKTVWKELMRGRVGSAVETYKIRSAKSELAEQLMGGMNDTKADFRTAYQMTLHSSGEADRAFYGANKGRRGLRVAQAGDANPLIAPLAELPPDARQRFADLFEFDQTPGGVGHGNYLYLTDYVIQDVVDDVGEKNWEYFEDYGWRRAALARYEAKGHQYPGIHEDQTPEVMQREIDRYEAEHPEWKAQFERITKYMNQQLLVSVMSGEISAMSAIQIAEAYSSDYWPLPRAIGGQFKRRSLQNAAPTAGIERAHGSPIPFASVLDAVSARTRQALDAYYQNRMLLAVWEATRQIGQNVDLPLPARAAARRIMVPLRLDNKKLATLRIEEQQQVIADYLNEQTAKQMGTTVDQLPDEALLRPGDISISGPGLAIFRQQGPKGVNVVAPTINGERVYFEVADPLLFEFISRSNKGSKSWMGFANFLAQVIPPWKRGITQTWPFTIHNAFARDPYSAVLMGQGKISYVPFGSMARALINRVLLQTGLGGDITAEVPTEMLSRTLDATMGKRQKGIVDSFVRAIQEGYHIEGWANMSPIERGQAVVTHLPQLVSNTLAKPLDVINTALGSRWASQYLEALSREGAYLTAKAQGLSDEKAQQQYDFITGNFIEKSGSPNLAALFRMAGFVNPGVQMLYQTYHKVATQPGDSLMKLSLLTLMGGAMAAINALFWDEEDRRQLAERSDEDRLRYFQVALPFKGVRLRMPFDYGPSGAVMSVGYNMVEAHLLKEPLAMDGGKAAWLILDRVLSLPGVEDFLGPHIKALREVKNNHSSFFKEMIVPPWILMSFPKTPELQTYDTTPMMYNRVGKALDMSPIKVEYLVRQMLTSSATDLIKVVHMAVGEGGTQHSLLDNKNLANLPWVGRLFTRDNDTWKSKSVNEIAQLDEAYRAAKDVRQKLEEQINPGLAKTLHKVESSIGSSGSLIKTRERELADLERRYARREDGYRSLASDISKRRKALAGMLERQSERMAEQQQIRATLKQKDPETYAKAQELTAKMQKHEAMHEAMGDLSDIWSDIKDARKDVDAAVKSGNQDAITATRERRDALEREMTALARQRLQNYVRAQQDAPAED